MKKSVEGRIYLSPPHMGGAELEQVKDAFESNFIAPAGPQLRRFEERFQDLTGFAHCLAVSSGTAAMHLALRLTGVGPGDMVAASSLTFIGSVSSATFLDAELAFVDCDRETWNMDPSLLAEGLKVLDGQGRLPAAVVPTDLYGQCVDLDAISEVCAEYDVPVIVDAAESVGATYKGRHAGKGASAAIYSFNGNKIITTSGGGMLGSDDKAFIEEARRLSQQARDPHPHYEHTTVGYNYRMSNVVAAIGLGQLDVLDERVKRRREIFQYYKERLGNLPGISFMPQAAYGRSNCWLTVVLLGPEFGATPEEVRLALEAEDIESRPMWKPMHMQPVFKDCVSFGGKVSEELFAQGLCLPSGTAMTEADLDRVCKTVMCAGG